MNRLHFLMDKVFYFLILFLFISININAQDITVSGQINEQENSSSVIIKGKAMLADNEYIPGMNILIKGTTIGTITKFDSDFQLEAKRGDVLIFSNIGYTSKEWKIPMTGNNFKFYVNENLETLDEVVVIGYGTQKKKEVSGAVAQVKSDELTQMVASDVGNAIQGRVAGVNVSASSGQPGAAANIQIRGISSVSGNNTPLYVVDGIPQDGDPRLNPYEIETMDILKDAASCAIYGTRGSNGVILITTKRGKEGKLKVSYDGSAGVSFITSDIPLMNTQEQLYFNTVWQRNVNGTHDEENNHTIEQTPAFLRNDTNLMKVVQNDQAFTQNHSVTVAGGNSNFSYSVVGGYVEEEGVIINSNYQRFNGRANTSYKNKKWQIDTGIGFSNEKTRYAPWNILTQAMKYYPYQPPLSPDTEEVGGNGTNAGYTPETLAMNWVLQSLKMDDQLDNDRFNGNVYVAYELAKGLKISTRLGGTVQNGLRKTVSPLQKIYNNQGELINDPRESFVRMMSQRGTSLAWESGLNYQRSFGNHKLTATAVFTMEQYTYGQFTGEKRAITDNSITVINGATLDPNVYSGMNPWNRDRSSNLIGSLARVMYDYKGKYLLSASVRRDGSSKFAEENRWGLFPSVSAAWNVADENFWSDFKETAGTFKIRGSFGTTGNQNFADYAYSPTITQGIDYIYGVTGADYLALGAIQTGFSNELVKWETSVQSNLGIDLGMFNDKLTFSADIYKTDKRDMLFPLRTPPSAGAGSGQGADVTLNVGNMTNQGIELALGYRTIDRAVNCGITGTYTKNQNVITQMSGTNDLILMSGGQLIADDLNSQVTGMKEGYEAGAYFLIQTDGVVNSAEKLEEYKKIKPDAQMGDMIFVDANGDGVINDDDRVYSGSALPDFELGAIFDVSYKNWDFSMQWYGAFGGKLMNGSRAVAFSNGRHADLVNVWSEANSDGTIPAWRGDSKKHVNYAGYTDFWLEDGTYLRLKNIMIGYTLGTKGKNKLGINKMRIYISGQNLITLTKYTGFDPEIGGDGLSTRGLDRGNYPVAATVRGGIQLDF
ncbi:TonB-dependent receptor [Flammeovirga sp. MY04]|uniref:SusC/RagA family TonB-linked outer membrane protein n=1 Tax=Flammeovirga sp. MY04 TaxID=1191459 RepID=UPI0008060863|nr:TonB-dependent receptor [Flammeovirga sp. MY04]ANQ47443.1 TonB-dependent receptor [Flammeovirga sp. MY04]